MNPETPDRESGPKLGDEWRGWDGRPSRESAARKRLFFALSWAFIALLTAGGALAWYMVAPRLAEWHAAAPDTLLVVLAILALTLGIALGLVTLMLLAGWPTSAHAAALARRMLALIERRVFGLGRLLSIDKDRLANAFIRTSNALVRLAPPDIPPERILLLLPRCLRKEQLDQARALARARGIETAVVAGGEQARQRIQDKRPKLVVGVACERDLLSGLRDMDHSITVIGIANRRPDGPCRNTHIDLAELEAALTLCTAASSAAKSATAEA